MILDWKMTYLLTYQNWYVNTLHWTSIRRGGTDSKTIMLDPFQVLILAIILFHGACQNSGRIVLLSPLTNCFRRNHRHGYQFAGPTAVLKRLPAPAEFQGILILLAALIIEGELHYNWQVC